LCPFYSSSFFLLFFTWFPIIVRRPVFQVAIRGDSMPLQLADRMASMLRTSFKKKTKPRKATEARALTAPKGDGKEDEEDSDSDSDSDSNEEEDEEGEAEKVPIQVASQVAGGAPEAAATEAEEAPPLTPLQLLLLSNGARRTWRRDPIARPPEQEAQLQPAGGGGGGTQAKGAKGAKGLSQGAGGGALPAQTPRPDARQRLVRVSGFAGTAAPAPASASLAPSVASTAPIAGFAVSKGLSDAIAAAHGHAANPAGAASGARVRLSGFVGTPPPASSSSSTSTSTSSSSSSSQVVERDDGGFSFSTD
jgi:hypothetical protein